MNVQEILGGVQDALSVKRVFGEPYEKDGVTVIPVAAFSGGAGGGGDNSPNGGGGGGMGLVAKPAGAYVIRDGRVDWQPAFDLNRTILGSQIVFLFALLVWRSVVKTRAKRKR